MSTIPRLVATIVLLIGPGALAAEAPPPDVRAEARERFDRGVRLFEDGDNAGALAEFRRAHDLIPNRLVLFNVGLVYAAMNRPVEAADTLERVLQDAGPLSPERVERARQVREEQSRRIARLTVTANVAAMIEVDGIEVGRTPLTAPLRVAGGTHVVGALAPGHLPSRREVTVAGGAAAEVRFDLTPTEARLAHIELRSPVPGADVLIDGALAGRTPLAASLAVPPGAHVVELRRAGYRNARQEIALAEGARGELRLDLDEDGAAPPAERGRLVLAVSEQEAHVTVDGRPRGVYRESLPLPAGVHTVRVERAGFEPSEREVLVPAGAETTVRITLRPTPETRLAYVERTRARRTWSWVSLGTGLAIAAGGSALAFWAHGSLPDLESRFAAIEKDQTPMGGGECDRARGLSRDQEAACVNRFNGAQDDVFARRNLRTAALVGAGVGAALAVVGVVLRATGEDPDRYDRGTTDALATAPAVLPLAWASPAGGGLGVRLGF